MVGGGSQKTDTLEAGDIELDFDDGQFISNHNWFDSFLNELSDLCSFFNP